MPSLDTIAAYIRARLPEPPTPGEIAAHFGLGWSGTDRHGLSQVFPNYDDPTLVESGLVIESEDGRRYDRFRERVMFPIRNVRGSLIGFGGRIIGKGEPKYLNSPETPLFSKGHELYGLWEARQSIRQEGQVIVVEGYVDVIAMSLSGYPQTVAPLGTAEVGGTVMPLAVSPCRRFLYAARRSEPMERATAGAAERASGREEPTSA